MLIACAGSQIMASEDPEWQKLQNQYSSDKKIKYLQRTNQYKKGSTVSAILSGIVGLTAITTGLMNLKNHTQLLSPLFVGAGTISFIGLLLHVGCKDTENTYKIKTHQCTLINQHKKDNPKQSRQIYIDWLNNRKALTKDEKDKLEKDLQQEEETLPYREIWASIKNPKSVYLKIRTIFQTKYK